MVLLAWARSWREFQLETEVEDVEVLINMHTPFTGHKKGSTCDSSFLKRLSDFSKSHRDDFAFWFSFPCSIRSPQCSTLILTGGCAWAHRDWQLAVLSPYIRNIKRKKELQSLKQVAENLEILLLNIINTSQCQSKA